jgi:hypothetical protein
MRERKSRRVQQIPAGAGRHVARGQAAGTEQRIADDRRARRRKMDTDLVGPARDRLGSDERPLPGVLWERSSWERLLWERL